MISRLKKLLIKYPIIVGIMCILALMGGIVCYWYYSRTQEIVPTVIPQELSREQNIESLILPEDAVEYFVNAVINEDLDQAMRVFPIDELCLNQNFADLADTEDSFSLDFPIAPSLNYRNYFPIASAELTGRYANMYNEIVEIIGNTEEVVLETIDFILPEQQLEPDFQLEMLQMCEKYGADAFCYMEAMLSQEGKTINIPFTVVNYDGYWKIFRLGSDLEEQTTYSSQEKQDEVLSERLKDYLEEIVNGTQDTNSQDEEKDEEHYSEEEEKLLENGDALLPPNYFVTNAVYEESPEELMRTFVRYIQKQDLTSVLTLGNVGAEERNLESTTVELLEGQAGFAERLKYFYYSFLLEEDLEKTYSLEQLKLTGQELLDQLSPQFFFYLDMREMIPLEDNQYRIYFRYESEYYSFIFEFSEYENGWQIKDIRNAEKLTEQQYNKEIQD